MSGLRFNVPIAALAVIAASVPASALAQTPARVRVVSERGQIQRWFRTPVTEVIFEVATGTTLEVLDKERDWFWVITPPGRERHPEVRMDSRGQR